MSVIDPLLDGLDSFLEWMGDALNQNTSSYCELETADSEYTLVSKDGSLLSIIALRGARFLVGSEEFEALHEGINLSLKSTMAQSGHAIQVMFNYDIEQVKEDIRFVQTPARQTAERLGLELSDLFDERENFLSHYCAQEKTFLALWTRPNSLSKQQIESARKKKLKQLKQNKIAPTRYAQSLVARFEELRDAHQSFVRATVNDFKSLNLAAELLDVHTALREVRMTIDPDVTDNRWRPVLPGDKIPVRALKTSLNDISNLMWPTLARQLFPRDGENLNLRFARVGDRIYAPVFIDLFPQEIKSFNHLMQRVIAANIPWRISFLVESDGLPVVRFKAALAAILSFASTDNALIHDASKIMRYIETQTDDSAVKLRVALATWAKDGELDLLRTRVAELTKAVQGWGLCEVSEISGDAFGGTISSALGVSTQNFAVPSVAPLSEVVSMLPFTRPASPWSQGAILFRSPDGKLWPYQPGSTQQTTWIDLVYARPGSGKSVLSNAMNLALCLSSGISRLPRIAIIDIGPSSSGLISLLREALPRDKRHWVAYHRMRMNPEFSINPFDTQLGCRIPTPLDRAFLVNFVTLLATPIGATAPYDGITDMVGIVIDELYKQYSDEGTPHPYSADMDSKVDAALAQVGFQVDDHTTWWEITDALFAGGHTHEAMLAQRFAMPLLADAVSVCRSSAVHDLFGKVTAPTGENLVEAFGRMISSAVREYPILARVTQFDIGDARVVSLDLDEVAKTGGDAADRQTAVMYMLARYVLGRNYYLTLENVNDMPEAYRGYHRERITEIREDPKRLVYDEFHRTSRAQAVRDQVIVDMREGRKWKVQVSLLSQAVDDFDSVMVDFATGVFIMDAGPQQAVEKSAQIFGLSPTAKYALRTRVHGPKAGGGTFLAQFATKAGNNMQLLTNTLGPIELWSFSTTAEDARIRNELYDRIGPVFARKLLADQYPSGTVAPVIERRMNDLRENGLLEDGAEKSIIDELLNELLEKFENNPRYREMKTQRK